MILDLTVVVVTHNSRELLPALVESLPAGLRGVGSYQLVIVDNASGDGTADAAARLAPEALVIRRDSNGGYAAGINAGVAAGEPSRAVLVLNPDVRLGAGCACRLLEALEEPGTGIAVPRLLEGDGSLQHSLRREPTLLRALTGAAVGGWRAGRLRTLGEVVTDPRAYLVPQTVDWASGAVMALSRACLDRVGLWDESFFLYSEEVEYALRARDRGFLVRYVPDATAVHLGGEGPSSPRLWSLMAVNRVRLFARRHGPVTGAAYWGVVTAGEAVRAAVGRSRSRAAFRALLRGSRRAVRAPGGERA